MKIGIWLNPNYSPTVGGGFSYYDRLIKGIDNYTFAKELEICFITTSQNPIELRHPVIQLSFSYKVSTCEKLKCRIPLLRSRTRKIIAAQTNQKRKSSYTQMLKENGIRLIFYPTPYMCELPDFPFVTTHWDIGHRSTFTFPEVAEGATFYDRENFYTNILPKALLVLTESNAGRQELINYTHLNPDRIKVVPLFAGDSASIKPDLQRQQIILQQFNLEEKKYFYYPAQFWAHKNHYTLLKAFSLLKSEYPNYKLVFSGSDQGNLDYIKQVVNTLRLNDSVVFAGFINNEAVNTLYRNTVAMVMPTLMGPTNMPPLEAMEIRCPVICSDLPGHHEELGDAAIYINPLSEENISQAMKTMIEQREDYVKRINEQREKSVFRLEHALEAINTHLRHAVSIRDCWE